MFLSFTIVFSIYFEGKKVKPKSVILGGKPEIVIFPKVGYDRLSLEVKYFMVVTLEVTMKIYDITQDIFKAEVYPGDPVPAQKTIMSLDQEHPDACQLTEITLGSHTGTHMDAPRHFYRDGKRIDEIDLEKCVGSCKVVEASGEILGTEVEKLLSDGTQRLLIKGDITITLEAAAAMAKAHLKCIGVEGLTVGPISSPGQVHLELLGAEIVIVEGLRMNQVSQGSYQMAILPMKLGGLDGAPVRAILMEEE